MDISFYVPRGCYYLVQGGGTPYWKLNGLNFVSAPGWIDSVAVRTAENIAWIPCFNNKKIAAIVGDDFGDIQINITALLGANAQNKIEGELQGAISSMRASRSYSTCTLSSKGGGSTRFILTGYGVAGWLDKERNILNYSITGRTV